MPGKLLFSANISSLLLLINDLPVFETLFFFLFFFSQVLDKLTQVVFSIRLNHREPAQSVCVADGYFIVNVLALPFASPIAICH